MLTVLLSACTQWYPLSEVPVTGGTKEQRTRARQELAMFDTSTGVGRLLLRDSVSFVSKVSGSRAFNSGDANGLHRQGRIWLDQEIDIYAVAEVLQHELCHALDEQEDLSSQREELFLDLFKPIVAETLPDPDLANDEFGSDSERVRETFAYTCEAGSDVLPWLADSCNAQAVELGRWLDDQVWVEVEELDYRTLKPSWLDELELDCAD